MPQNPPIVVPFVNWPGASPQDRAMLLTFWVNVILTAANRGLIQPKPKPGLFLAWKKSDRGNYWVKVRDTHMVVFKRDDQSWGWRMQRDGYRATYLKTTCAYPHSLLDAFEKRFGKPADFDNRAALVDFTSGDFDAALARDPLVVSARLEEERDRAARTAG
jgi:hypothetical protein